MLIILTLLEEEKVDEDDRSSDLEVHEDEVAAYFEEHDQIFLKVDTNVAE